VDVAVERSGDDGDALDRERDDSAGEMFRGLGSTPSDDVALLIAEMRGLAAAEGFALVVRLSAYERNASGVENGAYR
jgi:hypothetical protein